MKAIVVIKYYSVYLTLLILVFPVPALAQNKKPPKPKDYEKYLVPADKWWILSPGGARDVYMNKARITRTSSTKVKAWVKLQLNRDQQSNFDRYIDERKSAGFRIDNFDDYDYSLVLEEFDCSQNKLRILSTVDYDFHRNALDSRSTPNSTWFDIIPESVGEQMIRFVCGK